MKKVISVLLILCVCLCFTGCENAQYVVYGLLRNVKDKTKSECYTRSVEILRCFDEGDIEGLKSFFCQHTQEDIDIGREIEEAFDFYRGKSVSFKFNYNGGVSGSWRDGKAVDEHISPDLDDITTDSGQVYEICYHEYLTYTKDEECVGITYMMVYNKETNEMVQIGEYVY